MVALDKIQEKKIMRRMLVSTRYAFTVEEMADALSETVERAQALYDGTIELEAAESYILARYKNITVSELLGMQ